MRDIRFEIDAYLIDRFKDNQSIGVITDHDDHAIVLINGVQLEESYDAGNNTYFVLFLFRKK